MKNTIKSEIQTSIKQFVDRVKNEKDFITLDEVIYKLWGKDYQINRYESIPSAGYHPSSYEDRIAVKEILKHGEYMTYSQFKNTNLYCETKHPKIHGSKKILVLNKTKL